MSRGIKVDDQVYDQLDQLRGKSQTFSQVIQEILNARESMFHLLNSIEGALKFNEWKLKKSQELQEASARSPGYDTNL